ncbi:MAG TPA: VOC family protein [Actinocrinis sp.]|nr:VOC family protein [Actinocrinis sp.]
MALHRLTQITIGVPDVGAVSDYYAEFGLEPIGDLGAGTARRFGTVGGGEQMSLVPSARRRLVELRVGADDPDDIARIAVSLARIGVIMQFRGPRLFAHEPGTGVNVVVEVAGRLVQRPTPMPVYNAPGYGGRPDVRAAGVLREARVRPRKLGHVVLGSTDQEGSQRFFTEGLGFKVSDSVPGLAAFMRCSTDHHNVLVQQAPVPFLHHTSWQVEDVDEVGRGASAMLEKDPGRHVWGLGRHHIGSNFFWYLRDPAGNFSEYYADLDCIVDDELWTPRDWEGMRGSYDWGPPPPASFLAPEDVAALMVGVGA